MPRNYYPDSEMIDNLNLAYLAGVGVETSKKNGPLAEVSFLTLPLQFVNTH